MQETQEREQDQNQERSDAIGETVDELSEWLKTVAATEGFVDVGFVVVVRNGRIVRKKRIHESVE
ncbi:MAG: hypothetical protein WD492_12835 [Alkalispirochaeta sp.]